MEERAFEAVRYMGREDLEALAVRAIIHIRNGRKEADSGRYFAAVLTGFLFGALVAASGFVLGASLG